MTRYAMPARPMLVRTPSISVTTSAVAVREKHASQQVSGNVRRHLAMERLNCQFFADVAGISIGRARHIYNGRRSATVAELAALANALGLPLSRLFEGVE